MNDYSKMTHEDEVCILKEIINDQGIDNILTVSGVWELLREEFNNEILSRWEDELERPDWRNNIEKTGEVSVVAVSASLGVSEEYIIAHACGMHKCRFVGGTSKYLIWKEDAIRIEEILEKVHTGNPS